MANRIVSQVGTLSGLVGFCKKTTQHRSLPLKRVELSIHTRCVLASIQAVLEYKNDATTPVEVEFLMPMDAISVVTGLSAQLGGREVRGVVKKKEEAKDEYDDAVASGQTALYGEQEGKDLFKMVLGNLSAGASAELRLSLLQEMEREETGGGGGEETSEALRFCLPTTLKPRYSPAGAGGSGAGSSQGVGVQYELKLGMVAEYAGGLSRVESPSHKISTGVEEGGQQWRVEMVDPNPLEKDFVILLYPTQPSVPALMWGGLPARVEEKGSTVHPFTTSRSLMLSFLPQFGETEREETNTEIIFLIDRSGSMRGEAIKSAGATLELLVRSLSPGCALNIIGFGSGHNAVFPGESRNYDEECVERAVAYARTLAADMGGTEILSPLESIFRQAKRPGLPRQVVLLTDGGVSNTEQVLRCVRENRGQARVFAIGIGSGVSSALVRGVAEAGGGRAVFVSEGERMQGKILKLLSDAMTPCYTDVAVSVSGEGLSLFPSQLPQLFPQDRLVVYGLLAQGASVEGHSISLRYKQGERSYSHLVALGESSGEAVSGEWIHKLCCSAVLREWEGKEGKEKECLQLSCDTNLVCAHTALVGVDSVGGSVVPGSMQHIKLRPPSSGRGLRSGIGGGAGMMKKKQRSVTKSLHQAYNLTSSATPSLESENIRVNILRSRDDKRGETHLFCMTEKTSLPKAPAPLPNFGGFGRSPHEDFDVRRPRSTSALCMPSNSRPLPNPQILANKSGVFVGEYRSLNSKVRRTHLRKPLGANNSLPPPPPPSRSPHQDFDVGRPTSTSALYMPSRARPLPNPPILANKSGVFLGEYRSLNSKARPTHLRKPLGANNSPPPPPSRSPHEDLEVISAISRPMRSRSIKESKHIRKGELSYSGEEYYDIQDGTDSFCTSALYIPPDVKISPPPPPSRFPHEELISHQTAQGYWDRSEGVDKLLQLSADREKLCPQGVGEREWTTLLCLVTLELKFPAFKDEWQLVARKGWKWLKSTQLSVSMDAATEAARKAVQ